MAVLTYLSGVVPFVAITLVIVLRASRNNKTAADYYAAGRSFTGGQNGTAHAVRSRSRTTASARSCAK